MLCTQIWFKNVQAELFATEIFNVMTELADRAFDKLEDNEDVCRAYI